MRTRFLRTRNRTTVVAYRAESLSLFAAMTVPLSDAQKLLVDTEMGRLIDNGVYAAADALYFPMLVTEQQSCINWKSPGTYTLIPVNFSTSFVTKDGFPAVAANSTYLRTQFTPFANGVHWAPSDAKVAIYVKNDRQDDGRSIGGISNGNTLIRQRDTSNQFIGRLNGGNITISNSAGDGLFSISTSDGANIVHKRNNTILATTAATFNGSTTNSEILAYCWNDAGSPTITPNFFIDSNTIQCIAMGGSAMSDAILKTVRDNLFAGL